MGVELARNKNSRQSYVGKVKPEILVVYNEPPVQISGGNIRVYNLVNQLKNKCNVTLLILPRNKNSKNVEILKKELSSVNIVVGKIFLFDSFKIPFSETLAWWWNRYFILRFKRIISRQDDLIKRHWQQTYCLRREIKELLKKRNFDTIQIEHMYLADCIRGLEIDSKTKKILDLHNVHSGMAYGKKKKKMLAAEKEISKYFDVSLVCSENERKYAEDAGFKNVKVISNGVDSNYFKFQETKSLNKLLFVGGLGYGPNREGLIWFLRKIHPFIPEDMVSEIIGELPKNILGFKKTKNIIKYSDNKLFLEGFVEDIRKYVKNSIFVCPIRSGGGTRLKILMAASSGMPIITTSKGVEGLNFKNGKEIIIANTPSEFIMSINKLRQNEKFAEFLIRNARKRIDDEYSWECIGKIYSNTILKAVKDEK